MMYDGDGGWAWWWMIPMMLMMLVAVAVIVWAIVRATGASERPQSEHQPTPDEILDRRLASGEIDGDEYRARRDILHRAGQT